MALEKGPAAGQEASPGAGQDATRGQDRGSTRIRVRLAYVGTNYVGWQVQAGTLAQNSVQGQLEMAVGRLAGTFVRVHGAGRTDSGVHAEGQCAHFDFPAERLRSVRDLRHALNALLPRDIRVFEAMPCEADFHARFSAVGKTYRYLFWQDRGFVPPRLDPHVWCSGPLDAGLVRSAFKHLAGGRDFAALANAGTEERGGSVRVIHALELAETRAWPGCLPLLQLHVTGSGFLKQMVRNMAGLLADIGRGRLSADRVPELLAPGKRESLPTPTAPARGLTLVRVHYSGQELDAAVSGRLETPRLFL